MISLCVEDYFLIISTKAALSLKKDNTLICHEIPPQMHGKGNVKEFETRDINLVNATIQATRHKTNENQELRHNFLSPLHR